MLLLYGQVHHRNELHKGTVCEKEWLYRSFLTFHQQTFLAFIDIMIEQIEYNDNDAIKKYNFTVNSHYISVWILFSRILLESCISLMKRSVLCLEIVPINMQQIQVILKATMRYVQQCLVSCTIHGIHSNIVTHAHTWNCTIYILRLLYNVSIGWQLYMWLHV